jgi:hypothetical protein
LKYFKASEDIINYAKDIILDVLPLKDMNKICTALGIEVNISFVDEDGHCHTPKKYCNKVRAINEPSEFQLTEFNKDNSINESAQFERTPEYNFILMFEHYIPNIIIDKSINTFTYKSMKLSSFISYLFKHDFFNRLHMKYCKTDTNTNIIISDYNYRLFKNNINPYGKIYGSYKLINSLLKDTYSYHGLLKKFIKNLSFGQILFYSKIYTDESLVELEVNSLFAYAMTKLYAVKGKPKIIEDINDIDYLIIHSTEFIIEVDIISINEKDSSRF